MKRICLLFTLIFSLFFFSFSTVNADAFSINIESSEFDLLTDEFYQLRDLSIEYANSNNKYYIITTNPQGKMVSMMFDKDVVINIFLREFMNTKEIKIDFVGAYNFYSIKNDSLSSAGSGYNFSTNISGYGGYRTFFEYLDTNYNVATTFNGDENSPLTIISGDYTYTYELYKPFPSLYDIYIKSGQGKPDHSSEENLLLKFFNLFIEKILYLSEVFSSNYIFLSIFVIFILMFVIEIIRRLL